MTATPRSGDRIILDSNVLADRMVGVEFSTSARAADQLLTLCCVICWSTRLWQEAVTAVHQRKALPVPWAFVPLWQRLGRDGKLLKVPTSKIATVRLPESEHRTIREADPDDVHLLSLAIAAGAQWLVTRDARLLAVAANVATVLRVVAPKWVLEALTL